MTKERTLAEATFYLLVAIYMDIGGTELEKALAEHNITEVTPENEAECWHILKESHPKNYAELDDWLRKRTLR
jgi:hypothetical protein